MKQIHYLFTVDKMVDNVMYKMSVDEINEWSLCYVIRTACYVLMVVCYALRLAWYVLKVVWYALRAARYVLKAACYVLMPACYFLRAACSLRRQIIQKYINDRDIYDSKRQYE